MEAMEKPKMTDMEKMLAECSTLCLFLAENSGLLSKDTRLSLIERALNILVKVRMLENPPDPF